MKIPSELNCPIRITKAGSHSLNEFQGVNYKSFGTSYAVYIGSIKVAIIKECRNGTWATSQTQYSYNSFISARHAIKAILKRLTGDVGHIPEEVKLETVPKQRPLEKNERKH